MSAKKHHKDKCRIHPERLALGSCKKCGTHLCHECALIVRGIWYCFEKSCRPDELSPTKPSPCTPPPEIQKEVPFLQGIAPRLFITLLLCMVVLATVSLREIWRLKEENSVLKESRMALIELFRNQNQPVAADVAEPSGADTLNNEMEISVAPLKKVQRKSNGIVRQYHHVTDYPYNISNGPPSISNVALTFDGGSSANAASAILDTLASRSVKATMFITGEFIRKYPDVVRRIISEGHECGNHSLKHLHLTTYESTGTQKTLSDINKVVIADQLQSADALFFSVTGTHFQPIWRGPYGEFNREICQWGFEAGYFHVGWRQGKTWLEGLDSNDWIPDSTVKGYRTPEEFLEKITKLASLPPPGINGGIILMHLGTQRVQPQTQTHLILGAVIDTLRAKGFSLVPVTEMITASGIDLASLQGRSDIQ